MRDHLGRLPLVGVFLDSSDNQPRSTHFALAKTVAQFPRFVIQEARGAVLLVYLLRAVAGTGTAPWNLAASARWPVLLATLSMLFAVMCVYLYNGLTDVNQDRVNGSRRPLASGNLSSASVRNTILGLLIAEVVLALEIPIGVTVCNAVMLILGFIYSGGHHPAKMNGACALAVAGAGAMLPYLSSGIASSGSLQPRSIITAALLGLWVWAGGAAKDLSDVQGDEAAGRRTLPVRVGGNRARLIIAIRAFVIALAGFLFGWFGAAPFGLLFMPVCAAFLVILAFQRPVDDTRHSQRRLYRGFMLTQYALNGILIVTTAVA